MPPEILRADIAPPDRTADDQLKIVAARLTDIATMVAREAEAATTAIRDMTTQARQIARLAGDLEQAANLVEANVQAQAQTLAAARRSITDNEPAIQALAQSVETVSSISGLIAKIAKRSQLLSINARIEAARAGPEGEGFAVVAREMSLLSSQTKTATNEIGERAQTVARDVEAARRIVLSGTALITTQDEMLEISLDISARQRSAAAAMTEITAETATRIDDAAAGMGRVGSTAVAVKLLARQIARIAEDEQRRA